MVKIIGGIVVLVLVIGAWWMWHSGQDTAGTGAGDGQSKLSATSSTDKTTSKIASIKEAMGLGKAMQCAYALDENGRSLQSSVTVDGEKFRSVTTLDKMTVYGVFDGENQYSWTSAAKTGTKVSKACLAKMMSAAKEMSAQSQSKDRTALNQVEDLSKSLESAKNVKCEAGGSLDLTLPKDVTFSDQCALMEQSMKLMEQMKGKLPAGVTVPAQP